MLVPFFFSPCPAFDPAQHLEAKALFFPFFPFPPSHLAVALDNLRLSFLPSIASRACLHARGQRESFFFSFPLSGLSDHFGVPKDFSLFDSSRLANNPIKSPLPIFFFQFNPILHCKKMLFTFFPFLSLFFSPRPNE